MKISYKLLWLILFIHSDPLLSGIFDSIQDPVSNCLDEVVVSRDLACQYPKLPPIVPVENAQHGPYLMVNSWCQLQVTSRL